MSALTNASSLRHRRIHYPVLDVEENKHVHVTEVPRRVKQRMLHWIQTLHDECTQLVHTSGKAYVNTKRQNLRIIYFLVCRYCNIGLEMIYFGVRLYCNRLLEISTFMCVDTVTDILKNVSYGDIFPQSMLATRIYHFLQKMCGQTCR